MTPVPILDRFFFFFFFFFFFDVLLIALVKARHALYWIDSSFSLNELSKTWLYRTSPWSRCCRVRALYIVISVVLGNILRILRKRPTALLTLTNNYWGVLQLLIWNLIWHPGTFEKEFKKHYYCLKLKVGWSISLICDWKWLPGLVCSGQDWNSFSIGKPNQ